MIKLLIILFFLTSLTSAREIGQTEITTEEGIEVFQNEKYYLLKKNVIILSDDFELKADLVKAYFDKDLYDIISINSEGNVKLSSSKGIIAIGQKVNFDPKNENILILGTNSSLVYKDLFMKSDEKIQVKNLNGEFDLKGKNSELKTDNIIIIGNFIKGNYITINEINEIENLIVEDDNIANIKTKKINMFANKAIYNKKENTIELFNNVKIVRDNEIIFGDYANINTLDESYKVISKNSQKVKVLIKKTNE